MKALTIEELKALKVGDWVWIVDIESPKHGSGYWQIHGFAKTHIHLNQGEAHWVVPKSLYGKDWISYKNKEQAEAMGEIVELPKDKWVITRHAGKKTQYTYQVEHIEPYAEFFDGEWHIGMSYNPYRKAIEEYDTEVEAEARLKELREKK